MNHINRNSLLFSLKMTSIRQLIWHPGAKIMKSSSHHFWFICNALLAKDDMKFLCTYIYEYFHFHKWPLMVKKFDHRRSKNHILETRTWWVSNYRFKRCLKQNMWSKASFRIQYPLFRPPEVKIMNTGSSKTLHLNFLNPNMGSVKLYV